MSDLEEIVAKSREAVASLRTRPSQEEIRDLTGKVLAIRDAILTYDGNRHKEGTHSRPCWICDATTRTGGAST